MPTEDSPCDRRVLTFAQAEGVEPLPQQLKPKVVSAAMTAKLWAVVHHSLNQGSMIIGGYTQMAEYWTSILKKWHVHHRHGLLDEYSNRLRDVQIIIKAVMTSGNYVMIFDFLQCVIRHPTCPRGFAAAIETALVETGAAYRVIDKTITPIASEAEAAAVVQAFEDVRPYDGARAHLRAAASHLTAGRYADSVRESIHAVEGVARVLEPSATTLAPALARLARGGKVHPALKDGFNKLYGFTSDEGGIRHALLEAGNANVDEVDAMYMFGACASFVTYLVRKGDIAR